jgi:hypothetical protein
MPINLTNNGKDISLSYLVGKSTTPENLLLKLFTNNITTLSSSDTAASYTEASGGGYTYKTLTGGNWTIGSGIATYPTQTWTFTGAVGNVYGYYLVRATTGDIVLSEKFSGGPYNVQTNGDNISVDLSLTIS